MPAARAEPPITSSTFTAATVILRPSEKDGNRIRTVPELIEYNARENADHVFCIQARKPGVDGNASNRLLSVTHLQIKQAILQCEAWLTASIAELKLPYKGSGGNVFKGPPIALLVESDIGLLIHLLSGISLGVPVSMPLFVLFSFPG
jgi:hypothetical protein